MSLGNSVFEANQIQIARPIAPLAPSTAFAPTSGTAYWTYLGYVADLPTLQYVRFVVRTAGSGAQTAEIAFASSTSAPNRASQSLTKLAADGTLDTLTGAGGTGVKGNTTQLASALAAPVHLWAGVRFAMATTQPQVVGCMGDFSDGFLLETAAAGALTGAGPWTGTIPTFSAVNPTGIYLMGGIV